MKIWNKLVRDKIPNIISEKGEKAIWRILDDDEYTTALVDKLSEETKEFTCSANVEELADILEVVYAIAKNMNVSKEELELKRQSKYNERGGFENKVFLTITTD